MTNPVKGVEAEPRVFAVICEWADRRGSVVKDEGCLAIIVEAPDANAALLAANAARPDLWEADGYTRKTAVLPAQLQEQADNREDGCP